jgi:hypothetical protein
LSAGTWDKVRLALQDGAKGRGSADKLVQLYLGPQSRRIQPLRGLQAVIAPSLPELANRWSGKDHSSQSSDLTAAKPDKPKTKHLVPSQVLNKASTNPRASASKSSLPPNHWFDGVRSPASTPAVDLTLALEQESDPTQIPLPEDEDDDDSIREVSVDVDVNDIQHAEVMGEETVEIDYALPTELAAEEPPSEQSIQAAKAIQAAWRDAKVVKARKAESSVTPFGACQKEMIISALAMRNSASPRYRFLLIAYYPFHHVALSALIPESRKIKEKVCLISSN